MKMEKRHEKPTSRTNAFALSFKDLTSKRLLRTFICGCYKWQYSPEDFYLLRPRNKASKGTVVT